MSKLCFEFGKNASYIFTKIFKVVSTSITLLDFKWNLCPAVSRSISKEKREERGKKTRQSWIHSTNWRYPKCLEALLEIPSYVHWAPWGWRTKFWSISSVLNLLCTWGGCRSQLNKWERTTTRCKVSLPARDVPRAIAIAKSVTPLQE